MIRHDRLHRNVSQSSGPRVFAQLMANEAPSPPCQHEYTTYTTYPATGALHLANPRHFNNLCDCMDTPFTLFQKRPAAICIYPNYKWGSRRRPSQPTPPPTPSLLRSNYLAQSRRRRPHLYIDYTNFLFICFLGSAACTRSLFIRITGKSGCSVAKPASTL